MSKFVKMPWNSMAEFLYKPLYISLLKLCRYLLWIVKRFTHIKKIIKHRAKMILYEELFFMLFYLLT